MDRLWTYRPASAGHIQSGAHPDVSLYVQVGDLRSTIDKAISLGGKETIPPFDLANGQTLAAIEDPEGNFVMLVQQ
jgi:predicted enzyme related to lactoylglutathione lyase